MATTTPSPSTRLPLHRFIPWRSLIWVAAFFIIYFLGLYLAQIDNEARYHYRAVIAICIFITAAVSLNLINGITGQFSLGHAGFMTVGGYVAAALTRDAGASFPLALLVGGAAAALLGVLVGLPTLRLRGDYLAIATLGMGEIVRVVFENIQPWGGAGGFSGIRTPKPLFPLEGHPFALWGWSLLVMMLTLFLISRFVRSSHGRACVAIREDELAAETVGIDVVRFKVLAFSVGAFFAGIAGGLLAHLVRTIMPSDAGFLKSVEILVMVVLGGLGSLTGSVIAAAVLTVINFITADSSIWPAFLYNHLAEPAALRNVVYALLLVLLMIFRPHGLWPGRRKEARRVP